MNKETFFIELHGRCDHERQKAIIIASKKSGSGLKEVKVIGKDEDVLVVVGYNIDVVKVAMSLRKRLDYARVKGIEDVKMEKKKNQRDVQKETFFIELHGRCDHERQKAIIIASKESGSGLKEVKVIGKDEDVLVVVGYNIDVVKVAMSLRKRLDYARVKGIEDVKMEKKKNQRDVQKEEEEKKKKNQGDVQKKEEKKKKKNQGDVQKKEEKKKKNQGDVQKEEEKKNQGDIQKEEEKKKKKKKKNH